MTEKITGMYLERLRRYITDEAERLGKKGNGIVHKIDLEQVDKTPVNLTPVAPPDPMERDLDVLFGSSKRNKRLS